ncbi:hypothetical protein I3271_07355 [Photobacterium leiognathi]|uniref:hypothetical protein n=1 Tax=Photobacterium leiognathi TaxID=553611 RepID=UPI001EDD1CEA|nr:hypothetical protein [Photobacterium leiognathi]MCG3884502.1 hypothetical protein [Photobacterium leiognathi]
MKSLEFLYSFDQKGVNYSGSLFSTTGVYAGGSISTSTTTETRNGRTTVSTQSETTVHIRTSDGKVSTVYYGGDLDIPHGTMLTAFYYEKNDYLHPFLLYVHDTDDVATLSSRDLSRAVLAVNKWGIFRRLYGRIIDLLHIVFSVVVGLLAGAPLGILGLLVGILVFALLLWVTNPVFRFLGGTFAAKSDFEDEIKKICVIRAQEIEKSINSSQNELHVGDGLIISQG